jgi:hypothetical protein
MTTHWIPTYILGTVTDWHPVILLYVNLRYLQLGMYGHV